MNNYTSKKIFKLRDGWKNKMQSSWGRGNDNIKFVEMGEQSFNDSGSFQQKEKLVFNICNQMLQTAKANGKEIDLTLDLVNKSKTTENCDAKEKRLYKSIINEIFFTNKNLLAFRASLDKVYSFGQSVLHIKNVRENEETLNEILSIETLNDPSTAFFDYTSISPTFNDGKFCGRTYKIKRKNIIKIYKKLKKEDLKKEIEIVDFWFKSKKSDNYFQLENKQWVREDLINPSKDNIINPIAKKGWRTTINFIRAIADYPKLIEKKMNLPFNMLPMVMDYGNFIRTCDGWESYPLGYHLKDAQILINYAGSSLADILKSQQADKWIFSREHINSKAAKENADEINTREGGLIFDGDIQTIRREPSQQLPESSIMLFSTMQQVLHSIGGAYFDDKSDEIKAISGVALDKIYNRTDLAQNNTITAHISTINIVGEIIRSMIPAYYNENRTFNLNNDQYSMSVQINQQVNNDDSIPFLKNDINEITQNYCFSISASPSERLQKQNTQIALDGLYRIFPPAAAQTIDLYASSLNIPLSDEISRRVSVNIPPELIKYGNGDINYSQYEQISQQKMQQQMQQQMMQQNQNPESQYLQAKIMGEQSRAQTAQYDAQTARLREISRAKIDNMEVESEAINNKIKNENDAKKTELERYKAILNHFNDIIKANAGQYDAN